MADASLAPIKGAGRCPACACRKVQQISAPSGFYAEVLEVCVNCKAVWEPIDPALIWDPSDPVCSFSEPCGNCAFRPGSPEQADREKWKVLIEQLKLGGRFFCHKGVPIDPESEDGFKYPTHVNATASQMAGQEVRIESVKKMRLCRGYLNMMGPHWRKQFGDAPVEEGAG